MASPYPLLFEPILKQKVWGGRRLAELGKTIAPNELVGESWEIADLASTSPGGGGGDAARSLIANGELAGKTLHDAIALWGEDLLGATPLSAEGGFPLLVKFLDARENLSVQVHPSLEYVRTHPEAHLKTEAWLVVQADPGAVIYAGLRPGVTREQLESSMRAASDPASGQSGRSAEVGGESPSELLEQVPAIPGECHLLPSGTVHALGAGVVVLEVQTPSDTTFRLFDWNRRDAGNPRELHIDQAVVCAQIGPAPEPARPGSEDLGECLCVTDHFDIWSHQLAQAGEVTLARSNERGVGLACLSGDVELHASGAGPILMRPGDVALVPSVLAAYSRAVSREPASLVSFGVGAS